MATTSAVRAANARDCLVVLREAGSALSVGEIAEGTGLSRPTVDAVLLDLVRGGAVSAAPLITSGAAGRPARRFAFEASAGTVAALDIGARSVRCLVSDLSGRTLTRTDAALSDSDPLGTLEGVLRETGPIPDAVGLAVPGILSPEGHVAQSLAVPALVGLDLAGELSRRLDRPVIADNDIKLAALAEHQFGEGADSIVLLELGHRISLAVILDGTILQGAHHLAGELGSQRGMRWTDSSVRGRLTWSTGEEAEPLLERAGAGDPAAQSEIEEFCAQIAPRLATVLLTVDPERLVVGGGLSRAGETLLGPLRRALERLLMTEHPPEVVAARITADGAAIGALARAFEHGSARFLGVPDVPAPWSRFLTPPSTMKDLP